MVAVVCGVVLPVSKAMPSCTQSQIVWTLAQPASMPPKRRHAVVASSSDGQSRLGRVCRRVSAGSWATGSCHAPVSAGSAAPGASTLAW